tara:strand:+ start:751 stop:1371 length:621 start_codon:yes stop_codon:yes gene_type:complete
MRPTVLLREAGIDPTWISVGRKRGWVQIPSDKFEAVILAGRRLTGDSRINADDFFIVKGDMPTEREPLEGKVALQRELPENPTLKDYIRAYVDPEELVPHLVGIALGKEGADGVKVPVTAQEKRDMLKWITTQGGFEGGDGEAEDANTYIVIQAEDGSELARLILSEWASFKDWARRMKGALDPEAEPPTVPNFLPEREKAEETAP